MSGITGMTWPLAEELEAAGYEGDLTVTGLMQALSRHGHIRIYSSQRGWMANITTNYRDYEHAHDRSVDVALAQLWLKLNPKQSS